MEREFERLARALRAEADAAVFNDLTEQAVIRGTRRRRIAWLRTRAAAVTAGLVLGLGSFGGAAYAADGAAPGDAFYWLDRLAESFGLNDGGAAERLAEVQALVDDGYTAQGIQHAADTVLAGVAEGAEDAKDALIAAADRLEGFDHSEALDGVGDLLTYLSNNLGAVDGPTVAQLAKLIAAGGPPDGVPGGLPVDPPDPETPPSGDPGPPDGVPVGPPTSSTTTSAP
ncbi:MAG: hypothetical protein R3190_19405 [Thermoanaerobaculia bacterium]|nr:hypothetical protein [Thermoanaerobaculia bacterium]